MLFDTPLLNTNATPVSSAPPPSGRSNASSSSKRKRSHSSSASASNAIPLGRPGGAGGDSGVGNVEINVEKLLKKMKQSEGGKGGGGADRQQQQPQAKRPKKDNKQGKPAPAQDRQQQPRQNDKGGKGKGGSKKSRQQRSSSPPPPTPDRRAAYLPPLPAHDEEQEQEERVKPVVLTPGMTLHRFSAPAQPAASSSAAVGGGGKKGSVQDKLRAQLAGGKFRMLNEQLYTTSGAEAYRLMKDEGAFDDYHIGFRSQAATWPVHPLALIARALLDSLDANSLIADFGCGDAALARSLCPPPTTTTAAAPATSSLAPIPSLKLPPKLVASKRLKVASFDLVSQNSFVVEAECSSVPLPGGVNGGEVVDAVVCCLSLMGTDWVGIVREARRVLRVGGVLKIAEVTSRFPSIDDFIKLLTSLGFSLSHKDYSNTHFLLLDFTKTAESEPAGKVVENTRKSEKLLNPCIYKRR
ncbi:hypothetical protein JCM6882_000750 [Rhodosporidiobolus microsporus]